MSAQLRTIKKRIRSVENTRKITRAMEMVSTAKLRRFQGVLERSRPFAEGLENTVLCLKKTKAVRDARPTKRGHPLECYHPLLEARTEKNIALVVMTSDTGLCGSYNHDLIHIALEFLRSKNSGVSCLLIGMGKTGITALRRNGYEVEHVFTELKTSRIEEILEHLSEILQTRYEEKGLDAVHAVHSRCLSLSNYAATLTKLLPLKTPEPSQKTRDYAISDYIFEPAPERVFEKTIPLFFKSKMRILFLESLVSEQIARMNAMHLATENATDMIRRLTILKNKARQAAITKELIEIVSGSNALKIK